MRLGEIDQGDRVRVRASVGGGLAGRAGTVIRVTGSPLRPVSVRLDDTAYVYDLAFEADELESLSEEGDAGAAE